MTKSCTHINVRGFFLSSSLSWTNHISETVGHNFDNCYIFNKEEIQIQYSLSLPLSLSLSVNSEFSERLFFQLSETSKNPQKREQNWQSNCNLLVRKIILCHSLSFLWCHRLQPRDAHGSDLERASIWYIMEVKTYERKDTMLSLFHFGTGALC